MKILEHKSFWFSFEPGNTGNQSFWFSFEHGNTGTQAILIRRPGGRAAGSGDWDIWLKNPFSESVSRKILILYISLNPDFLIFFQKRCAPTFHEEWRDFRGEISHMRPIQGQKLKLFQTSISRWRRRRGPASYFFTSYFIIPHPASYFINVLFY